MRDIIANIYYQQDGVNYAESRFLILLLSSVNREITEGEWYELDL
jgi:hypothetical protein